MSESDLGQVRRFWDAHPCGAHRVDAAIGSPEFFRAYRAMRYASEWHLDALIPWDAYAGKRILEIGCGMGADGLRFARAGARYTAVDASDVAVATSRAHFMAEGAAGAFHLGSAEALPFADHSFDLVFSHGVLHHTPDIVAALREVARVLRPGGDLIVMLYHRRSFNRYVRILGYMRARVLLYALWRRLLGARPGVWEAHVLNLRRMGWCYLSAAEFPHHGADGPDCPIANSYTRAQVRRLLEPGFEDVRLSVAHFPVHNTFRWFPLPLERLLAQRIGWYLFAFARRR